MASIAGMMTEEKNIDFIRIFMVATVKMRIFRALLSPSYEIFIVTLRMATLYKILILCVGFALSCNLWAQSHGNSMQTSTSPLKIERDALGAVYYWIDNNALDLDQVDYSDLNGQDNYFARVEYYIEGNVINRQEVGGPYCLIELAPTRFEITKNDVRSSDDYVGVYATETSKVFIIAPLPENFSSALERIKLNTHDRQLVFNDSSVSALRTAALYKHKLPHGSNYTPF